MRKTEKLSAKCGILVSEATFGVAWAKAPSDHFESLRSKSSK